MKSSSRAIVSCVFLVLIAAAFFYSEYISDTQLKVLLGLWGVGMASYMVRTLLTSRFSELPVVIGLGLIPVALLVASPWDYIILFVSAALVLFYVYSLRTQKHRTI